MKKLSMIALFLCFSLAFIVILPGCSKDPQDDDPVNPITPTITTNPVADKTVPVGSDESISWESQGLSSITVKVGEEIKSNSISGSIPLDDIKEEIVVLIVGFDKNNEPIVSKEIRFMPQTIPLDKPTLNLVATPNRLSSSGSVTITWTTTDADSVLHENVWYPPNGSISHYVTDTTTYQFTAKGPGGQVSDNTTIYVGTVIDPPLNYIDLACINSWKKVQYLYTCEEEGVYNEEIDISAECNQDNRMIFNHNGICTFIYGPIYCEGGISQDFNFSYIISNDTIFGLGDPRKILYLDSDTLIWEFHGIAILPDNTGVPTILVEKFVHP